MKLRERILACMLALMLLVGLFPAGATDLEEEAPTGRAGLHMAEMPYFRSCADLRALIYIGAFVNKKIVFHFPNSPRISSVPKSRRGSLTGLPSFWLL